nr:phosphoesterase [Lactococcus ileimucosae]
MQQLNFQSGRLELVLSFCYNLAMKKLALLSDLHLDVNEFTDTEIKVLVDTLQSQEVTDLHFAGDMSNDYKKITAPFFNQLSKPFDISHNLGNHDMVHLSEKEINAQDFSLKYFGDTLLISFHGWYDYSFTQDYSEEKLLAFKNSFYFDRKIHRNYSDVITTQRTLTTLETLLENLDFEGRIIIAMHFVPHKAFSINTTYKKFERFNAYLGSQAFHDLFIQHPQITDVVFGHAHHRISAQTIDGIVYHSRPLGYTYEWQMVSDFLQDYPEYKIEEHYHLRKRYQAIKALDIWRDYRTQNLSKEFLSSLSFFNLPT